MAIDIQGALDRLCAIEKLALASLSTPVTADAVPYSMHTQESFPYFVHRQGAITVDPNSKDIDLYEVEIIIRLVIGHITEGYRGELDGRLNTYIPAIMGSINERELLQSPTYLTALNGLESARCVSCTGTRVMDNAGIQGRQVGAEFTVICTFADDLTQVYL